LMKSSTFCELLHRQVGGLLALEDAIDPACGSLLPINAPY
jgi:hypothetical protein